MLDGTVMHQDALRHQIEEIQAYAEHEPDRALGELDRMIDAGIESAAMWMLKACIHFQADQYFEAAEAFSKVIKRQPNNANASLGLFHSLWSRGERDAAFEEMKRYFRFAGFDSTSQAARDYSAIVREING